ncbi:hypothetical protein CAEBREN_25552 [Caenorhabditis brenneri]|uniref:BTB domain-containing protein n=1 Tax=Caenorhabditis brenneri TaxID=135651 RepID=G0MV15_CAEBE|nr:hypothetical protein CAEBREN_25552 [Caenorhabditis brenneri]
MSTEPSRKREGDNSNDDPPSKVPVFDPRVTPHDVVLIVKGQKFYCLKEKLAKHSTYFEGMFFKEFSEKDKKEVKIGELRPDVFQLFIDALNGINSITDEYSEIALDAAIFLGSATFEDKILQHFAENSEISLKEQFKMAEEYKTHKLMVQVCASIKDAYQLDEVVPKDLDSFCNRTKNLVMQRSFELLGIRKPPSPPLPEDPDQYFENRMNQIIDQVEIHNHHGQILGDQIELLLEHVLLEGHMHEFSDATVQTVRDNPLIKELVDELQEAHEPEEVNFIQAQIMVLKCKDCYTEVEHLDDWMAPVPPPISAILEDFAIIINRNKRPHRSYRVTLGDRKIDEEYRSITEFAIQYCQNQPIQDVTDHASWIERVNDLNGYLSDEINKRERIQRLMPDGIRQVSNTANFRTINEFVSNIRSFQYSVPRVFQPVVNEEVIEDGPVQDADDQNRDEQDQEDN